MFRVVSLEQAKRLIRTHWKIKPRIECVPVTEAVGKVLAGEVKAEIDHPPFHRASADGYAVQSQDTVGANEEKPIKLEHVGSIKPGEWPQISLQGGQCAKIETGAPLPPGADAVVPIEFVQEDGEIYIFRPVAPWENVSKKGSRVRQGDILLKEGQVLGILELGLLTAGGVRYVNVYSPPRVGLISTGNELVSWNEPLAPGKITDINGPLLSALLRKIGCGVTYCGIAPDQADAIGDKLRKASSCDLIILTGGTSAGKDDLVPRILSLVFHGIAVRPGKPTAFGFFREKPVFALPGNPLSAFFMFLELVRPFLLELCGKKEKEKRKKAELALSLPSEKGKEEFVLVKFQGRKVVPMRQGSDSINLLSQADGYVKIPAEVEYLRAGEKIEVNLLGDG